MKLVKKILSLLLIISLVFSIASCRKEPAETPDNVQDDTGNDTGNGGNTDNNNDKNDSYVPEYADYTVTVLNVLGQPISGVSVFVHKDGGADYNVCATPTQTDKDGKATFKLETGKLYSVGLLGVPGMYVAKSGNTRAERYALESKETLVVLENNEDYVPAMYKLGDTMPNFTLTDINGNDYELYELLKEKKAVVLNFWFYGCGPCQSEFPALNKAYNNYKSSIEVLAINDYPDDSISKVKNYAKDKKLTLDMPLFKCEYGSRVSLSRIDSIGYPTTLVIDRYGKICFIHVGAVTSVSDWNKLFAYFTAEDYTSTVIKNFSEIN